MSDHSAGPSPFAPNLRPDPRLRDRVVYPLYYDVAPRFQDLDVLGHINNVAMGGMFEEARFSFGEDTKMRESLDKTSRLMVASVQIHFLSEAFHGSPIRFHIGVGYLGTASWRLRALGWQGERAVMIGDATVVHSNQHGPAPIPNALRAALQAQRLTILQDT